MPSREKQANKSGRLHKNLFMIDFKSLANKLLCAWFIYYRSGTSQDLPSLL
jgi:hypothetical protein